MAPLCSLVVTISFVILVSPVWCVRLPQSWCNIVAKLCQESEESPIPPNPTRHFVTSPAIATLDPLQLLCPDILIWSPLEQLHDLLKDGLTCPKCDGEKNPLSHGGWKDGQHGKTSEPRRIYATSGIILLVGRVYRCSKGHEVAGYHPGVLTQIPIQSYIPFRLWHKTGKLQLIVVCEIST